MMKGYSEYTDSAIEGVDKAPSNWNVMRFRHLFSIGRGLGITKENLQDDGIPCVNYGEIHSKYGFELDLEKHPLKCVHERYLDTSPSSLLNKGDLVYADTSEDLEGSGNFTQLISDGKTFAGYHTVIARQTRNHDDRFLAYALDSDYCRNQIRRMVKGVKVFSITQAILKDTSILLPSYEEQRAISSFLDVNTSRIDNLIAEKENFIKLLQEKRQALISHVVTKGLNPNVPMKDSGVEWIGKIPESWSVSPIRYLVEYASTGGTPKNQESFSDNGDINWFAPGDFKGDLSLCSSKKKITRDSISTGDAKLYPKNSVIVIGIGATLGKVAYSEQEFSCNQQINILVPNKKVNYQYLAYAMSVQMEQMKLLSNASTIGIMNQEKTKSIVLALPNVDEQKSIISFLDNKLDKIKAIEKETNNSIELLKEHRTALISAAVTGKIDVREEV